MGNYGWVYDLILALLCFTGMQRMEMWGLVAKLFFQHHHNYEQSLYEAATK